MPARDALPSFVAPDTAFTTGTLRTRWTYDANGQLEDEVDAKGQTKHHVYGPLKRLASVTYSGHVAPRALPSIDAIAWTYRGEGEVETCSETKTTAAGVVTEVTRHFYDALERRARTRRYDGTETTYGYDVKGNRTLVRDSEGVETGYTWDSLDRLATATTPLGTATYRYFEDGLLKQTDYPNGVTEVRDYDAAGRLTSLETAASGVLVSRFEYAFDADGNRVRQVETRQQSAGEETTYGYDEAGRLIGVAYPSETHLYRLDAVGNRTGEKRLAQVLTPLTVALFAAFTPAQATAAVERQHNAVDWVTAVVDVKASTTTALTYDANGNRTAEGARRYRWDIRDTLTQVEDGASVVGTYDYDATLQRVKADTAQGHVEYVLDGKYVLREAGARQRRYHFGEGEALAVTGVGGTGAQDRWLHTDALGSVVTETDSTASSVTARQFDAWGNYRNSTAPGVGETRLGYTGHQYDVETGLTYARARYYDSKLGVFLSRDSFEGVLTEAPSLHRYTYAHNSPLRYTDPSGEFVPLILGLAVLGAELGFFGNVIHQEVTQGKDLTNVDYGQAGKAAAVGFVAGAGAGLAGATALGATAAVGVGGASGSVIVSGTVAGATGTYLSAAGSALASGQSLRDAHMMGAINAPLGALGGAVTAGVGQAAGQALASRGMAQGTASLLGDTAGGVVGDLVQQSGAVSVGLQDSVDLSQTAFGAGVGLGTGMALRSMQVPHTAVEGDGANAALVQRGCRGGNCGLPNECFVAGTLVLTEKGFRAIEAVRAGDLVWARDARSGAAGWKPVVRTFETPEKRVLQLLVERADGSREEFRVTGGHPFWVNGDGWRRAEELQRGDVLVAASGAWLRVASATWLQSPETVFNLEVAEWHTYFVGESAVWVHNACGKAGPIDEPEQPRSALDLEKTYADPEPQQYRNTATPDTPVVDHVRARALGGHPTDPRNLNIRTWSENSRKGWHEGNYLRELKRLVESGLTEPQARWVLEDYLRWIETDIHATPVDPTKLKKVRQ